MDGNSVLYFLPLVHVVCCIFYGPSSIHIHPKTVNNHSDFGFSMAYQKTLRRLVVGAPSEDLQGKVYSCDMKNLTSTVSCDENKIDFDELNVTYTRATNPEQKFFMGASIAATSDYFFTCAPLVTMDPWNSNKIDVYGTCIVYGTNGTAYKYKSTLDRYMEKKVNEGRDLERYAGGNGWTTLIDETNDLLLIAKPLILGELAYVQMSKPWKKTTAVTVPRILGQLYSHYWSIGYAITAVNFIPRNRKPIYAFSLVVKSNQMGGIAFLRYDTLYHSLTFFPENGHLFVLHDDSLGSIFGAALGAADVNRDGLEELLVGAPAYTDEDTVECGALHIYLSGKLKAIKNKNQKRTIISDKVGARFGSAIATQDIDGDGISEIIVSAPYEDEFGVVYVLSGFDIYEKLMSSDTYKMITIKELTRTQRIVRLGTRAFGFSLQFVSDFDENGCNELAVGSPGTGAVELYNCVKSVQVNMTAEQIGEANLRSDSLIVEVCAIVEYAPKPKLVFGELNVTNNIAGQGAYIPNPDFTIDFTCESCTVASFCENVTIVFNNKEGADYIFNTQAQKTQFKKEFNGSQVTTSPNSILIRSIKISRYCQGDDCQPQLSMDIMWSGSIPYVLGSSETEKATVWVRNDGNSSYGSCVRLRVRGAEANVNNCSLDGEDYLCHLPKPLPRSSEHTIQISLDMSKLTNLQADEVLEVEARLYERCSQLEPTKELKKPIKYLLLSNHVYLEEGTSYSRQVTDKDILDSKQFVHGIQEFLIINTGSISWYNISAVITMEKKPYIESYNESPGKCERNDTKDKVVFICSMNLLKNKTQKVIVTQKINKSRIESNLKNHMLNITSQLSLHFKQTGERKKKSVTSVLTFHKEIRLVNNKWLIILIAVVVATILLIILITVLCKFGFFKRKQKKKLAVLRESVRRRSTRRTVSGPKEGQDGVTEEGLPIDYDNDSAFEVNGAIIVNAKYNVDDDENATVPN